MPGDKPTTGQPWTYVDPMITDFSTEPVRLYVDADAPDGGDGLSWASAFTNPCPALDIATSRVGPVEIWVAGGMYAPTCADSGWNSFQVRSNVTLLGGFTGNETIADERDWIANQTILTGDLLGNDDIADEASFEDNALYVVSSLGARGGGVIDGFTIRDGQSLDRFDPFPAGTGLTYASEGLSREGDTIVHGHGELLVRNCRIGESNRGSRYGTVGVAGDERRTVFESSVILAPDLPTPDQTGTLLRFESINRQFAPEFSALIFSDCVIDLEAGFPMTSSGWSGGSIEVRDSVVRSELPGNPNASLIWNPRGPIRIVNSQFTGKGAAFQAFQISLRNNTFSVDGLFGVRGLPSGTLEKRDLEIYSNVVDAHGMSLLFLQPDWNIAGNVFNPTIFPSILDQFNDTNLVFDFETNAADFFVDPLGPDGEPYTGDEDLRLAPGSPAINTGLNAFVESEFDLDGNPRIIGTVADRGAYEFAGTCTGDVNGDGVIDLADLNKVLANFNQPVPFGDADGSGSVDMTDLNIVISAFGNACAG